MKKVSIIMATYNHEKYIRHALESTVVQKTNFEYEVLVGDDCSTDGTASIIKEFAEKYPDIIVPFYREKNLGMVRNTYDLLTHVSGEYIALLEGDDYWIDDHKLQKQVDFLDNHPDYIAVFCKNIIVDQNEKRLEELEKYSGYKKSGGDYTIKDFEEYLLPGQTATSMYRASMYQELTKLLSLGEFDYTHFIDMHLCLVILAIGRIYVIDEYLSAYRYILRADSGSWSSKNDYYSAKTLINYLALLKELEEVAAKLNLELDFDRRRRMEWDKLEANKKNFTPSDVKTVNRILYQDTHDKTRYNLHKVKRLVKKAVHFWK